MPLIKQTSKEYFKVLNIIYYFQLLGPVIFALILLYVNSKGLIKAIDISRMKNTFLVLVVFITISGFYIGRLVFKNRLKRLITYQDLQSKLIEYRGILIVRFAFLEGASLFAVMVYFLTSDYLFLAFTGIILLYFFYLRPTIDKVSNDLKLKYEEESKIKNPDEIVVGVEKQDNNTLN